MQLDVNQNPKVPGAYRDVQGQPASIRDGAEPTRAHGAGER